MISDEQVKEMVNRFLMWKLPENFHPDAGISFKPEYNVEYMAKQGKPPSRHTPLGTNLLNAQQAEEMVRHMLGDDANDAGRPVKPHRSGGGHWVGKQP